MKKILILIATIVLAMQGMAQNYYWVFLSDKAGTTFDPYAYFDAKAIERYRQNNADLYDITNYPLQQSYVRQVEALALEEIGTSRWLNAVAVMATPEQIAQIEKLECVQGSTMIASQMELAQCCSLESSETCNASLNVGQEEYPAMADQLLRMQGNLFRSNGIDGKGVRVAVFDGGFPAVNTHKAFKHLRDNNQIIATWNFCNKKENVYGWNTHGTMVLSCIAGILDGQQLGLATGATFLLARTEVEAEPYKEEVWWQQAMEWADRNGADIINSSLGYGKDRHYTYEMDGRSTVAHAANMAARKGMLVCNSAGNEGGDLNWKTIITPADADSILTVGGIDADLYSYGHIFFSSYGPTADGRLKPNVCNFGQASVADPKSNDKMTEVFGTSFSSPLTAGFVACAKQAKPNLTAMQLKENVEKSGDLYPYFDYAFGYGVPQASYFLTGKEKPEGATFALEDSGEYLFVRPTGVRAKHAEIGAKECGAEKRYDNVFMKLTDSNGLIQRYVNVEMPRFDNDHVITISKHGLLDQTLTVFFDGYAQDYSLSDVYAAKLLATATTEDFYYAVLDSLGNMNKDYSEQISRSLSDNKTRALGDKYFIGVYIQLGHAVRTANSEQGLQFHAPFSGRLGLNFQYAFKRWYRLGVGAFYGGNNFVAPSLELAAGSDVTTYKYRELGVEFFQRIRLTVGDASVLNGLFWDLGIYGSRGWNRSKRVVDNDKNINNPVETITYNILPLQAYKWNYGISTRLVSDKYKCGIFANYRINDLGKQPAPGEMLLPRLTIGLMLNF